VEETMTAGRFELGLVADTDEEAVAKEPIHV
jgi:hypothetical protein